MKNLIISVLAFTLIFVASSCGDGFLDSGPEIEWISGGTSITYTYSGGVISGYNFHRSFKVLDESGDITIKVQVKGDNNSSTESVFSVEAGQEYDLKVPASKSGSYVSSPGSTCLKVEFSSPNCRKDQEISVSTYVVSAGGIDTYYCPESLNFSEIQIIN